MKTSQFPAQTSLPSDAVIPYVSGNTNYTITLANFQNSLGVSGTIAQTGTNGVPVLDVQGSSKLIRNLVGGFGVDIQENELNGITISTAFTFDEDGAALVDDPSSSTPTFRSIVAGAGINVSEEAGRITISESGAPVGANTVVIYSVSDFAVQDATTITLQANTKYIFGAKVTTSKRFIINDGVNITGAGFPVVLEYTGSDVLFTSVNANWLINQFVFDCPSGTIFNKSGSGVGIMDASQCKSCVNIGTLGGSGFSAVNFTNNQFSLVTGQGFVFAGSQIVCSLTKLFINTTSASAKGLDFGTSVFNDIEVENYEFFGIAGSYAISAQSDSSNVASGKVATVSNSGLNGGSSSALSGISNSATRWEFVGNSGVSNTIEDALLFFRNNVTQTVIGVSNTPYIVAGTWVQSRVSKFTTTAAGRATLVSERAIVVPVDIAAQLKMASGGSVNVTVYLAKNGAVISDSAITASVSSSSFTGVNIHWQLTLNPNDYLEVFVANNTNTVNVIADQALLRIR